MGRETRTVPGPKANPRRPTPARRGHSEPRMRLGVELTEREIAFLRSLSRPARTGGPRTLGGKFVATGVLAALRRHESPDAPFRYT